MCVHTQTSLLGVLAKLRLCMQITRSRDCERVMQSRDWNAISGF